MNMETTMYSLRILSKGKITDLSKAFSLGGMPFTVFVKPKKATMETSRQASYPYLSGTGHRELYRQSPLTV